MDSLYCDLLEHKTARAYSNVFIPRAVLPDILAGNTLFMLEEETRNIDLLQAGAARLLRAYLDHFVSWKERGTYMGRMQPGPLRIKESSMPYRVRGPADFIQKVEALKPKTGRKIKDCPLYKTDKGKLLPRLHIDRHLFSPLLLAPTQEGVTIAPPGLQEGERQFLEDLLAFWKANSRQSPYCDMVLTLYRNLPHIGINLGRNGGFFPDFILWVENRSTQHVRFIEPHGLVYGGLSGGNQDKFDAIREVESLGRNPVFRAKNMTLGAFMLTETDKQKIPGGENKTWLELEKECRLLNQRDVDYIQRILHSCCP
jgi:hypothetical protein